EQLANIHLGPIRRQRQALQEAIEGTSSQVVAEEALHNRLEAITKECDRLRTRIEKTKADMLALMPRGKELRAQRLAELEAALASTGTAVDKQKRARVRVDDLKKEVDRLRTAKAAQYLATLKNEFHEAGLSPADWGAFSLSFSGDVDQVIAQRRRAIDD